MKLDNILRISYEELASYTGNFAEENYLGYFQFGKLYRGKNNLTQDVTVKLWGDPRIYFCGAGDNECRLMDEIHLLSHETVTNHPGMVKLYAYCWEDDHLGVVYKFKPFDSLFNLIPKDDFTWLQRIKVALKFASILKFMHTRKRPSCKPFIIRNLGAAHLVLDEDYNPKLCDFGLITGGIFPDRTVHIINHVLGCYGYIDSGPHCNGVFTTKMDIYAFGAILISLISKKVYTEDDRKVLAPMPYELAWDEYYAYREAKALKSESEEVIKPQPKFSFVDKSFENEPYFYPSDGYKLTKLGLKCTTHPSVRPTSKQLLKKLSNLDVVKENRYFFELDKPFNV